MSVLTDFYRNPTLSDGFGSTKFPRTNPHRGLDFPKPLGTPVPAYSPGVVVTSEEHKVLGVIVQVKGRDGRFVGYRHLRRSAPRLPVGARVEVGTIIGQVSDTGTAAHGFHLCTTNSSNKRGVFGEAGVADPWPFIQKALKHQGIAPARMGVHRIAAFNPPASSVQKRIQAALAARGRYHGPIDGDWGPNSIKGIQITIRNVGYTGPISGSPNPETCRLVQVYARRFGDYTGPLDSVLGPNGWAGFALGLERP